MSKFMVLKLRIIAAILLIGYLLFVVLPADAQSPVGISPAKIGDIDILDGGYVTVYKGQTADGKQIWEADLSAPKYLDDKVTPIDTQWQLVSPDKYKSGKNKFTAEVYINRVSIISGGASMAWMPTIEISKLDKVLDKSGVIEGLKTASKATILPVDPLNSNYSNNTLQWDYGNGIVRRLRLIEGMAIEYYIIDKPIAGDFDIKSYVGKSIDFTADRKATAWDADGKPIDIIVDNDHNITLTKAVALDARLKYPITIDPDTTFTTSASDGWFFSYYDWVWSTQRTKATAYSVNPSDTTLSVLTTATSDPQYRLDRIALYFDTSSLPDGGTITNAVLQMYPYSRNDNDDGKVYIVSGMPTYPRDPMVVADYNYTYYTFGTEYGYADFTTDITLNQYNVINKLNPNALAGIVSKTATTKVMLIERRDKVNETPNSLETNSMYFYSYEQGTGFRPKLTVTYTGTAPAITSEAATNIGNTTARLNSVITDDGGEPANCSVRFGWGTTSQTAANFNLYTNITGWVAGYSVGEHPYVDISGMPANTTHYYRAQIDNDHSTVTSTTEISFATTNSIANIANFSAYPSGVSINLNWGKASGSSQTLIRYRVDHYPTTTADGTQLYLGTSTTTDHTGLTAGSTYYYSAWGESGGNYSTNAANVAMTTIPLVADTVDLTPPTAITGWDLTPQASAFSNIQPFYNIANLVITDLGIPPANGWLAIAILFVLLIGVLTAVVMRKLTAGAYASLGTMVIFTAMGLVPAWMWFIDIISILGIITMTRQGVAE